MPEPLSARPADGAAIRSPDSPPQPGPPSSSHKGNDERNGGFLRRWWWAVIAAVVGVIAVASALALHLAGVLSTSDSASVTLVLLTLVVILVAVVGARYSLLSARAASNTVEPLQRTAATLTELSGREEHMVRALGTLLATMQVEARRDELVDELHALVEMLVCVGRLTLAANGLSGNPDVAAPAYVSAQIDLRAHMARFARGSLPEPVEALAGWPRQNMRGAPTGNARVALEVEIDRRHEQLRALAAGAGER